MRRACRRRRGRVAPRPPCMGWVPAPPLLLHGWGGRGGGRRCPVPAASGTPGPGPVACAAPPARSSTVPLRCESRGGRRSGRRASAGCRLGWGAPARPLVCPRPVWGRPGSRFPRKLLLAAGVPQATSRPPIRARGWRQPTEPDRHLPHLGTPRTTSLPETPRPPAQLICPALGAPGPAGAAGARHGPLVMDGPEKIWFGCVRVCRRV